MLDISLGQFFSVVGTYFWRPGQHWIMLGGIVLWLSLRRLLPEGSQYVLKQTITFFVLCLFGQMGAAMLFGLGFDSVASALREMMILGLGVALIRFCGLMLFRIVIPAIHIDTPRILEDVSVIMAYCVWGIVRLHEGGMDVSQIFATSAVMTAILAFAMQDTLGNILGGLAIHLDHSVEIGDWVKVGDISGRVTDIRWRYTKIATRNGEKVVVPNSQLMKGAFTVVGISSASNNAWRRWVWFNIDYAEKPARVMSLVEQELDNCEIKYVARNPAPQCVLMEFGPSYARYALRYWLTDPQYDDGTDSEVRVHVLAALQRAGIRMALPEETRYVVTEDAAYQRQHRDREIQHRLEALGAVALFAQLNEDELQTLASRLLPAPFESGDIIARQGTIAHWLYLLIEGQVGVWLDAADGNRQEISQLNAGDVFGEMGLMTGESRNATLIAKSEVRAYRLDKAALDDVLHARPAIAEEMAHILATREAALEQARQGMNAVSNHHAERQRSILGRIRTFFKLAA